MDLKKKKEELLGRLNKEYIRQSEIMLEIAEDIRVKREAKKYAMSFGDLSENAAYHTATEELDMAHIREEDCKQWLEAYSNFLDFLGEVSEEYTSSIVQKGSVVLLEAKDKTPYIFLMVPEEIEDAELGFISPESPSGAGLLQKRVNDKVVVSVTATREYIIKEIL